MHLKGVQGGLYNQRLELLSPLQNIAEMQVNEEPSAAQSTLICILEP